MLNTRVSVRTSCLRNFGQSGPKLNQINVLRINVFFLRFYSV